MIATKTIIVIDTQKTAENHRTLRTKMQIDRPTLAEKTTLTSAKLGKLERGCLKWTPEISEQYCMGVLSVISDKYTKKIDELESKWLRIINAYEHKEMHNE